MSKILVIEDEELMRDVISRMLRHDGYEVIELDDGRLVSGILEQGGIGLVVTDIIMPEKEGLEIITALKKEYPEIKIIAVSGGGSWGPDSYLQLARKFGADRTFIKPVMRKEFISAVKELIGEPGSGVKERPYQIAD
jgi:DNA-binding NtrC family response regulator